MYRCEHKCSINSYAYLVWDYKPLKCPRCGGKIVDENQHFSVDKRQHGIYIKSGWKSQHMQVGLDKVYCPTKQSYLDACKHGRIIHAGTREISVREIDPVGAKD